MKTELNLDMKEIIDLILEFYTGRQGIWTYMVDERLDVKLLLNAGLLKLDDIYDDKYVLNDAGLDFFHEEIKNIMNDFIKYVKYKDWECFEKEGTEYFTEKYSVDKETGSEIFEYVSLNMAYYGFVCSKIHQNDRGIGFHFEPKKE